MNTVLTIVIIVVVVLAAAAVFFMYRRRESAQLHERFGPEYERTLEDSGDRRSAERELRQRERRVSKLDIVPLSRESAELYHRLAITSPGLPLYPVDEFDQRVNDISVDHPEVAAHYRDAHRVAVAQAHGEADTEELRQAVTAYRALVDALLADSASGHHRTQPTDAKEQA